MRSVASNWSKQHQNKPTSMHPSHLHNHCPRPALFPLFQNTTVQVQQRFQHPSACQRVGWVGAPFPQAVNEGLKGHIHSCATLKSRFFRRLRLQKKHQFQLRYTRFNKIYYMRSVASNLCLTVDLKVKKIKALFDVKE